MYTHSSELGIMLSDNQIGHKIKRWPFTQMYNKLPWCMFITIIDYNLWKIVGMH